MGVGVFFVTVTKSEYQGKISDSGTNLKFQVGRRLRSGALFMIEYEVHHIRDETPELSEIIGDYPEHFKTYFLLASIQIYLYKGFFIRPSVGFAKNCWLWCDWDYTVDPQTCTDTSIEGDGKLAWGISVGYEYKLTRHIGVALETVVRGAVDWPDFLVEDQTTYPRRAFGIQAVGTWYF